MHGTAAQFDNIIPIAAAARYREARRRLSFGWVIAFDLALWGGLGMAVYALL